ncbi:MAG: hypothetical protein RL748_1965, partial [Pseudomonadota bacterium]
NTRLITRNVYDAQSRLRFSISAQGRVVEYRYNALGETSATIAYAQGTTPPADEAATEAQLVSWVAAQADKSRAQRTNFSYDQRGQLQTRTVFGKLDANGEGIADSDASVSRYVYDQSGQLLQTIAPNNTGATVYAYDGLGRIIASTDSLQQTTTTTWDDANQKVTVKAANGLISVSQYDKGGRLISLTQRDSTAPLSQVSYKYNEKDQLVETTNADGSRQWNLYYSNGLLSAAITTKGAITSYHYNHFNSELLGTREHATPLSAAVLAEIAQDPANAVFGISVLPQLSGKDRITQRVYDRAGRLLKTIDALGYVSSNRYDAAGRLIATTASARPLSSDQLAALRGDDALSSIISPDDLNTVPTADAANDRMSRNFYDADGLLLGTLDAEGYLTRNKYDGAGHLTNTLRYATATPVALRANGSLAALTPLDNAAQDILTVYLYDNKGQLAAQIDGEKYLTRYTYDGNGNQTSSQRYDTKISVNVAQISSPTDPALSLTSSAQDRISRTTYDALNRVKTSTDWQGTVTTNEYDQVGHLIASYQGQVSAADGGVRGLDRHYDLQGRLIAELSGVGSSLLHGSSHSQAEIDAIWRAHAIRHTYDAAGRRTSSTDQNHHTTLFYYDQAGQLAYSINAAGEVSAQSYTVQGQIASTRQYANRIEATALAQLVSSTITPGAARITPVVVADAAKDRIQLHEYDQLGRLIKQGTDSYTTRQYTYNGFGEVKTSSEFFSSKASVSFGPDGFDETDTDSMTQVLDSKDSVFSYDRRGQLLQTESGPGPLNYVTKNKYDAFGRLIESTDGNNNVTKRSYDRLGRVVEIKTALNNASSTTYDAFDRILTQTDGLNQPTQYTYDPAKRSSTITTPEGVKLTTAFNRYGQSASVTDGKGNVTRYEYDGNGQLLSSSDDIGVKQSNTWDAAGLLIVSTDGRGNPTLFTYDAANRVLTRTIDPTITQSGGPLPVRQGLNLQTKYSYDAFGQAFEVSDPKGIITRTEFDNQGQVKSVLQDAGGLNYRTSFTYDYQGNTLTVTSPAQQVSTYSYDKLGRRIKQSIAIEDGKTLDTSYSYDRNNNLVTVTDPGKNLSFNLYDAENRLTDSISASGAVVRIAYDANGREITRTAYANPVASNLLGNSASDAARNLVGLLKTDAGRDNVIHTIYNKDGRVRFSIDGTGAISENQYDLAGNISRKITWTSLYPANLAYTEQVVLEFLVGRNTMLSSTDYIYDSRNRVVYEVNALGAVIQYQYDGNDNLVQRIDHIATLTDLGQSRPEDIKAQIILRNQYYAFQNYAKQNHNQLFLYDAANRQIAHATMFVSSTEASSTWQWLVETREYDAVGNVLAVSSHAHTNEKVVLGGSILTAAATETTLKQWIATDPRNPALDHRMRYVYDAANRVTASATAQRLDANGNVSWAVVANRYDDAAGNLTKKVAYASALVTAASNALGQTEISNWVQAASVNSEVDNVTRYFYDKSNRPIFTVNGIGAVNQLVYDALGNVVQSVSYATLARDAIDLASLQSKLTPVGKTWANRASWLNDGKNRISASIVDAAGHPLMQIDALGNVVERQFDALGNAVQIKTYARPIDKNLVASQPSLAAVRTALGANPDSKTELQFFDAANHLRYQVDALGYVIETTFDKFNRLIQKRYHPGAASDLTPASSLQQVAARLNNSGLRQEYWNYNTAGDLSWRGYVSGSAEGFQYDALHNAFWKSGLRSTSGVTHEFDSAGHVSREFGPTTKLDGSNPTNYPYGSIGLTRFSYDVFGNLLKRIESGTDDYYTN